MWFRRKKTDLVKHNEADRALAKADYAVSEAKERGRDEINPAVSKLRTMRERNNFAELIRAAIAGGRG